MLPHGTLNLIIINDVDDRLVPMSITNGSNMKPKNHVHRGKIVCAESDVAGECKFDSVPAELKLIVVWIFDESKGGWDVSAQSITNLNKKGENEY